MTEYILSRHEAPDLERSRLELLEQAHDPLSVGQLDAIGVAEGWRCLDVGAGAGSVTRMLADRVGPTGSVLAVDSDTTLLAGLAGEHVDVRRLNLLADPLPPEQFDLVHARLLLMHLPSRLEALRRLAGAVRPGGWLATMEPDFSSVSISPTNPTWQRAWSAFYDALVAGGWDPGYGARLFNDLQTLELADIEADFVARRAPGGTIHGRLLLLSFERLRDRMVAMGASNGDIDDARQLLEDPSNSVTAPMTCVARARRPDRR